MIVMQKCSISTDWLLFERVPESVSDGIKELKMEMRTGRRSGMEVGLEGREGRGYPGCGFAELAIS